MYRLMKMMSSHDMKFYLIIQAEEDSFIVEFYKKLQNFEFKYCVPFHVNIYKPILLSK